jgi:hypothetical protein
VTLTKLRSATFTQLVKSADDPAGLLQMIRMVNADISNLTFDVYQHLTSGATIVIPSSAELVQAANGDCAASLASGKVQLRIQLGVLASPLDVQARIMAFENALTDGKARGWVADPVWTNGTASNRFDGLRFQRAGFKHLKLFPMYQDKYLFPVLAVRNSMFIGSAAFRMSTPQWNQKIAACNATPNAPACADAREYAVDLVRAMLGVQLTTFPVG